MSNVDGGNLRVKDESRDFWLKEPFHNIQSTHNCASSGNPHYSASIRVNYHKFKDSGERLYETLHNIKEKNGLISLMGQFYCNGEPYVMKIDHLKINTMVITMRNDEPNDDIIQLEIESTEESRLIEISGKYLRDMRIGEPFVFR